LNINVPEQRAELSTEGMGAEMNPMFSHSEIHFTGNNEISIYEFYNNGYREIHSSYNSWSGGLEPGSQYVWGGQTPKGIWQVTGFEWNPSGQAYLREGISFRSQLLRIGELPINREAGTFFIHPDGNFFGSNGCPVLQEGANSLLNFGNYVEKYLQRNGPLNLFVY